MASLPTGTQTFLMTDVVGSTRLLDHHEAAMVQALERHDGLMMDLVARHGGTVIKRRLEGDSFFAVFARTTDAVAAACAIQRAIAIERWPDDVPMRVRMAINSGEAQLRGDDYFGSAVNRCARLREIAHGGQILLSNAAEALVAGHLPPDVELKHLGRHKLRDLQGFESVYQIVMAGLSSDFPALASVDSYPNNLPILLSSFIGRGYEIETAGHLLHTGRLLTLTGPGGTGKTRLALQLAAQNIERFEDGVWMVDLASIVQEVDVARAVADAIGVQEVPGLPILRTIVDHIGLSRQLLIIDNCEHLLPACVELIEPILGQCPNARVLATSRHPLEIVGELTFVVPEMSLPVPTDGMATRLSLAGSDAVELFVERATARDNRFALTDANAPIVAQICRLLDGIPLALELAAPMVRVLSLEDIASRLSANALRHLINRDPTVDTRHRSVDQMIDWSYELLSPIERQFFECLAVFVDAFSLAAVEAVCVGTGIETEDVIDLLSSLIQQSLVTKVETVAGVRYRLLWTVREFAMARLLASGSAEAIRQRHANYYADLAISAGPRLSGNEQQRLQETLSVEGSNLEEALVTLRASGQVDCALEMAVALWPLWYLRGQYALGRSQIEQCLALIADQEPESTVARAWYGAGTLASFQGDVVEAVDYLERAAAMYRSLDDAVGEARAANSLAGIHLRHDRYDEAREALLHSLAVFEAIDDPAALAAIRYNLAAAHEGLAQFDEAEQQAQECLRQFQRIGNRSGAARCWTLLGSIAFHRGDLERAEAWFAESMAIFDSLDDPASMAEAQLHLGYTRFHQGDLEGADQQLRLAHEQYRKLGLRNARVAEGLLDQALVALAEGDMARGESLTAEAQQLAARLDSVWLDARVLEGRARVALARGELISARHGFAESLRLRQTEGFRPDAIESIDCMARQAHAEGRLELAAALAAAALRARESLAMRATPIQATALDAVQDAARSKLGVKAYDAIIERVRSWTWHDVIAFALSVAETPAIEPLWPEQGEP